MTISAEPLALLFELSPQGGFLDGVIDRVEQHAGAHVGFIGIVVCTDLERLDHRLSVYHAGQHDDGTGIRAAFRDDGPQQVESIRIGQAIIQQHMNLDRIRLKNLLISHA